MGISNTLPKCAFWEFSYIQGNLTKLFLSVNQIKVFSINIVNDGDLCGFTDSFCIYTLNNELSRLGIFSLFFFGSFGNRKNVALWKLFFLVDSFGKLMEQITFLNIFS